MEFKEVLIFFIVIILVLIFNLNNVNASALGLTPAIIRVDFQPNAKFLAEFTVLAADANQKLEVFATGDLSQYVKFDKTALMGQEGFTAYIDLPATIEKPGQHVIYIKVREILEKTVGIGTKVEVGAAVVVKVPYPGKYAEIKTFVVNNTNGGEPVVFYSEVENLGNEDLILIPNIEVYSNNKLIDTFVLENRYINHTTSESFTKVVEKGYNAGMYNATISFNYGKVMSQKTDFKVGSLFIELINWSSKFIKGKINEFNIEVESRWNNDVKNIYAEVNVTKNGNQVDFFKTPSVELNRWGRVVLKGFFNSENLETGKYQANISLIYEDKITEKIADIRVSNPPFSKTIIIAIVAGIVLFLMLMGVIVYLFLNRKKPEKNRK